MDTKCMLGVSLVRETAMLLAIPALHTKEPIVLLLICMAKAAKHKKACLKID